jgi:hypothetical protein
METVALIASLFSIALAIVALWQANHHRDQSDKLNRDTTEKLSRIEAFATSTKEDAFKELERWGDFARAGGKASEEAEKAKEEEMKKLKAEIQATTSVEINKVLQTVESKLSSSTQASAITEIKKQFEELKKEIGKIQEKGLGEVKKIESEEKFKRFWHSLTVKQRDLLVKAAKHQDISAVELQEAGISPKTLFNEDVVSKFWAIRTKSGPAFHIEPTSEFIQFLRSMEKDEMV